MIKTILERMRQGHRTMEWPDGEAPPLPAHFRGLPTIDSTRCPEGCRECVSVCPTEAIRADGFTGVEIDLGACLFCPECASACPEGAISFSADFRLACRTREGLHTGRGPIPLATALEGRLRKLFGRSLKLRQVSAGGCNACEADINVLGTVGWDLGRFGIQIVASPRHADGLLVTGPVTENMRLALEKTYAAVPDPKIVIAVGACAISGGPFYSSPEQHRGAESTVPVDLFIPGCPPHPITILDGLLRLIGRLEEGRRGAE